MKVIVDTCVWSLALRRNSPDRKIEAALASLIADSRAVLIGPIRQELLSGVANSSQFEVLKEKLAFFEDVSLFPAHFEKAAEFCNVCRTHGIQGANTDFLICAVSCLEDMQIFTKDKDFELYKRHLPIQLF